MRIAGALFLVVLLTAAAMLYLRSQSAVADLEGVAAVAAHLREDAVAGRAFDHRAAMGAVEELEELAADPDAVSDRVDELRALATTAAEWARAAPSPSGELAAAVAIRGAAAELREFALRGDAARLDAARARLAVARSALTGEETVNNPVAAIREGLDNLERSQQEPLLELDEELAR